MTQRFVVTMILSLAALVSTWEMSAREQVAVSDAPSAGEGLLVLLPGAETLTSRQLEGVRPEVLADPPEVSVASIEGSDFLAALRRALVPAPRHTTLPDGLKWLPCPDVDQTHSFLLRTEQAEEELAFESLETAASALAGARMAFDCRSEQIGPSDLGRYLFLQGLLELGCG